MNTKKYFFKVWLVLVFIEFLFISFKKTRHETGMV